MTNGQITVSQPFTSGQPDELNVNVTLPDEATVIGYIHTHPEERDGYDHRTPSDVDENFVRSIRNNGQADDNMLTYIASRSNTSGWRTYVYDKYDLTKDSPSCFL
jgi:hypothetical protein